MRAYIALRTPVVSMLAMISLLVACKSPPVAQDRSLSPASGTRPQIVYVTDFELGAETIKHETGLLAQESGPIVGRVSQRLYGTSSDPEARARQLVELMSKSLVKELNSAGLRATRLAPGAPFPSEGWLLRGIFTEVQEGNRVRRAMIGFGQGQTDVQVIANVHNLSEGPPKPLYAIDADASSGSKPGAAPTLVLGPYGAAARFVMAGSDLEKNVKQTAAAIAARISKRAQELSESPPQKQ